MAWISAQTDYGYLLCGMSLLVLAIFCFRAQSLPERRPPGLPLAALGGFALCHALHEWFHLALEFRSGLPLLAALPGALLLASCICLLEFGRRLSAPPSSLKSWCWRRYAPLLALCGLATGWGLNFQASTGLFLTLPAAFLSLRGMLRLAARQEPRQRRLLLGLGGVIALQPLGPGVWSALLELLAPDLVPAPLQGGAQLALHLAQGGVALLAALLVWVHSGSDRRRRLYGALFLLTITSILAGGWALTCFLGAVAGLQPAALVSAYRIFGIAVTCTVGLLALCCFVVLVAHHEARLSAEQLRVSAERLALAAEGANEAVWEWDMALDRGYLNQRFFELAGCQHPPEQCDYRFFLSTVHPEDRAQVAERVREHIEGETPSYLAQYRMVSRSGQVRDVMGRGRIVRRAPDGTPLTMAGVILDVTEQKRLADEVNRIRNLESVGILAGGLSHDFNNVLNVICGNVSFARMLARDPEVVAALGDAEQGCERALELGRRLQVLARGGHPVREPVALVEIARASAEAVFKEGPARWRLSAADDLHRVEADPRQMRQVFESLLLNAREALAAGGAVTVEIGNEEVGADSPLPVKAGSFVRATIRDDGKGIPPEDLQRVFDPYFSSKDSYHEKGMGLGLPICHAVIKRHQGHISIDSVMGRGTSVAVYLPASA